MAVYIPGNSPPPPPEKSWLRRYLDSFINYKQNPSFGLKFWGPLVPSSDNVNGLKLLTGCQIMAGMALIYRARFFRKASLSTVGVQNSFDKKFRKYLYGFMGGSMIYQAGFEVFRLSLPYDPWYEEARTQNEILLKNGGKPHWWRGAIDHYNPMTLKQFHDKFEHWVLTKGKVVSIDNNQFNNVNNNVMVVLKDGSQQPKVLRTNLAGLLNHEKFSQIYYNIKAQNDSMLEEMLQQLSSVTELNRAERIDEILEGKASINPDYTKPNIQLRNHSIETDDEFDDVWLQFEPWEELKAETDYDIRLIPRWRGNEDNEKEDKT